MDALRLALVCELAAALATRADRRPIVERIIAAGLSPSRLINEAYALLAWLRERNDANV